MSLNTEQNLWHQQKKKRGYIVGLSPMDGVTDAPFRELLQQTSHPDIIITEFVNVEGLARGAIKMLDDFLYTPVQRPVIAQIYGIEPESFYQVALMACYLGFDGIDINMGCPAKKVEQRGAGAGLIQTPDHAKKIIRTVQKAVYDFANGKIMSESGIRPKIQLEIERRQKKFPFMQGKPRILPVSVKTRMGYQEIVAEHWMEQLLETAPDAITLHGRTLKQKYTGEANWEIIAKACAVVKQQRPETAFLGNGDITSLSHAFSACQSSGTDGVLVGRATFGNPWFFDENISSITEDMRKKKAIEHCKLFEEIFPERKFFIMRKHLGWYMKDFSGAREIRGKLMKANNTEEVRNIFQKIDSKES